mmetsp:Transcript_52178/g.122562  ORF Transcript_52178/g.122562 Transcript_52178/m.122562 type:complete len:282 (-) Transcript_52178:311-1156(-)
MLAGAGSSLGGLPELDCQVQLLQLLAVHIGTGALHGQLHRVAWSSLLQHAEQIIRARNSLPIHGNHHISQTAAAHGTHSSRGSWPVWNYLHHHDAIELQFLIHNIWREDEPKQGSLHKAFGDNAFDILVDGVNRDSKANSGEHATAREDCCVDSDHLAITVQQRPSTIAWIDAGISLDDSTNWPSTGTLKFPRHSADDPPTERMLQAERISESEDILADQKPVRPTASEGLHEASWDIRLLPLLLLLVLAILTANFQDGHITCCVVANYLSLVTQSLGSWS